MAGDAVGVVLACMPFGPVFSPSIGLSLLQAGLRGQGIPSRVHYFSIRFAERIGQHFYCGIARDGRPPNRMLAGEWMFAQALFPDAGGGEEYVQDVLRPPGPRRQTSHRKVSPALVERIRRGRGQVDAFLEECLQEVLAAAPRIVGFTSVFQQHVASLALARRIKAARPQTFIVMGGANCEGAMGAETVRQFPFVDAAVSGEADLVFPELVQRVLEGRPLSGLRGVRLRASVDAELRAGRFESAPMVGNLDQLPLPDYDDYFAQFGASRFGGRWQPSLFFETSRGCWWGEKQHCTFCGLNGTTMAYRSKSAPRALAELTSLTTRHPGCDVQVTDNILDLGYFKSFLPALAERSLGVDLLYETKSNLDKDQLRTLRRAGIRRLQPGIESLSDAVLRLMRKGVSALQNIQLLKWCRELDVEPYWNVIWGFPGESPDDYAQMASQVPLLTHLPAPRTFGILRLDRFSPNFFDAEKLGFTEVAPSEPYRHIYPLPEEARDNLAYYFRYRYREPRDVDGYVRPLARALRAWKSAEAASALFSVDLGACLLIWDLRPGAEQPLHVLRGRDRALYLAADAAAGLRQLAERAGPGEEPLPETERRLEELCARGLVLRGGARWLALAVPLGPYEPPPAVRQRFHEAVRSLGRRRGDALEIALGVWETPRASSRCRDSAGDPTGIGIALGEGAASVKLRAPARSRAGARLTPEHFSIDERGLLVIRKPSGDVRAKRREEAVRGRQEEDAEEAARQEEAGEGAAQAQEGPGLRGRLA